MIKGIKLNKLIGSTVDTFNVGYLRRYKLKINRGTKSADGSIFERSKCNFY